MTTRAGERASHDPRWLVVALGSDVLRGPAGPVKPDEWARTLERRLPPLVDLVPSGVRLVLAYENGPQVSDALCRVELAQRRVPPLALDLCLAASQGSVGYVIEQVFGNLCRARGLDVSVAALLTRVVVDGEDPTFGRPTRSLGPVYSPARARQLERQHGWRFSVDGRRGCRRIVPSPRPIRVVEAELVRRLLETGVVPVVCGGGVPVVEAPGGFRGVEAVVDTDLATATLARELGADCLLFLTGAERVAVNSGTPREIGIERLGLQDARALLAAGEFAADGMGSKVEAGVAFVEGGGRTTIITSLGHIAAAIDGATGTHIVP